GEVTQETNVTLTAKFSKGTGADKVEVTKNYTVKLVPTPEVVVTKGKLLGKIEAAKLLAEDVKYTAASRNALSAAILEARAVYDNNSATQTEIKAAVAELEKATTALVLVPAADTTAPKVTTGKYTLNSVNYDLIANGYTVAVPATADNELSALEITIEEDSVIKVTGTSDIASVRSE
ncbi:hypothetical protein, partial [Staphylococcus aureus]|uniref:hypothetical protein n=1 Tax=Staphylococcus aureus TaxID=1280 RepID=UPI00148F9021